MKHSRKKLSKPKNKKIKSRKNNYGIREEFARMRETGLLPDGRRVDNNDVDESIGSDDYDLNTNNFCPLFEMAIAASCVFVLIFVPIVEGVSHFPFSL